MKIIRTFTVLAGLIIILAAVQTEAQTVRRQITGRILDDETGEPIRYASIFLANTTRGTTSLKDGQFTIERIPPGRYDLVISMMGYETQRRSIILNNEDKSVKAIRLTPRAIMGETVTVEAERDIHWDGRLKKFKSMFLGISPRAEACRLLNPEVLDFAETDNGAFIATASAPLEIENHALGYKLTFYLDHFTYTDALGITYEGDTQFTPLDTTDTARNEHWKFERHEAFLGSLQHFFRAVASGSLIEEGFKLYALDVLPTHGASAIRTPVPVDSLSRPGLVEHEAQLFLPSPMQVIYTRRPTPRFYDRIRHSRGIHISERNIVGPAVKIEHPTSYVKVHAAPLTVHRDGYIYAPQLITTYGYWAWERVGDMLPLDYNPLD